MPATNALPSHCDVLIIGAGSAGCVVANRLSANDTRRVVLLEAGPSAFDEATTRAIRQANQPAVRPGLNWKYRTYIKGLDSMQSSASAHTHASMPVASSKGVASIFNFEAGRLLGGSSAVNATQALRPPQDDFERWAQLCGPDWSWQEVLPFFKRLEHDADGDPQWHGRGGPLPILRVPESQLTTLHSAFMRACLDGPYGATSDHNAPGSEGVGVIPMNVIEGRRISSADAYLTPARSRPNLQVITDGVVHRLIWDKAERGRCRGAVVEINGRLQEVGADKVVLCAGVIGTPALLLRSGVGAPEHLKELGIPVELPLIHVGENLMEHPVVGIWGQPREDVGRLGEPLRQTLLVNRSSPEGRPDLHTCLMTGFDAAEIFPHAAASLGTETLSGLTVCNVRSTSRGRVRLLDSDARTAPVVWNNCLGDEGDVQPLMSGLRQGWALLHEHGLKHYFKTILAWTDGLMNSPKALEQAVRTFVRPAAHAVGTARMGLTADQAVVDPSGRVFGSHNLFVGDSAAMPTAPSAPPHLACLMMAEKLADRWGAQW